MHLGREDEYIMKHLLRSAINMSTPLRTPTAGAEDERVGVSRIAPLRWADEPVNDRADMAGGNALRCHPDLIARFNRDFQYTISALRR